MKILHIINYYHEGFGYQENYLPLNQSYLGCDVRIITSDYYAPFPSYDSTMSYVLGERKKGDGIYQDNGISLIRKKSILSNSRPGFIYFSVVDVLSDFYPDVVHVHGATNMWMPVLMYYQSKFQFKVFVDAHQDFSVENYSGNLVDRVYYNLWRLYHRWLVTSKKVSKYLPITKQSREWLIKRLDIPAEKQLISPLGVDMDTMVYSAEDDKKLRREWDAQNRFVIVNAGKQYKEKKILWIIDIAALLESRGVEVFLVLVGSADETYDKQINHKLQQLSKNSWIRLPFQKRNELKKIYSAADVGLWPGIPSNTIQEAMACRVALLLPDNDIVGHLVDGNGLYISDSDELTADALSELALSKKLLNKMKDTSLKVARKYSWKKIAYDLIQLYKS